MKFDDTLRRAMNGEIEAMQEVAYAYLTGQDIEQNIVESERWYEKLVALEDDVAAMEYAEFLYNGDGFEKNPSKAIEIIESIATKGVPMAQERLAQIYCSSERCDFKRAVQWRKLAVNQGYPDAILNMAIMYRLGDGVEKNYEKSMELLKSIANFFPRAYYEMAQIYIEKECYEIAVDYLQKDSDEACSQYQLGRVVMGDHGIERDMDKAVYWLERATKQNAVRPMAMLGCCYQDNTYGIANGERALYWFNRAIEAGDYSCYSNIGNMYASGLVLGKDIDKAVSYWTKAAECGCVDAQEYLSSIYRKADIVPENPQLAFYWANIAADNGSVQAQIDVAYDYFEGYGTAKDIYAGIEKMSTYANGGNTTAMVKLGCLYRDGRYVEQDIDSAIYWYKLAETQGDVEAINCLGQIYCKYLMKPEQGFEYYLKAARMGLSLAQINVAMCYKNGQGVKTDIKEQEKWLLKAAENDDDSAYVYLGIMYDEIEDYDGAQYWYMRAVKKCNTYAMCRLALLYKKGRTRNITEDNARNWLLKAETMGEPLATKILEKLFNNID